MKHKILILALLCTVSCQRALLLERVPEEDGKCPTLQFHFTVGEPLVKSVFMLDEDEQQKKISDLNIFFYKNQSLCPEFSVYTTSADPEVELPDSEGEFGVYVLANVGDVRERIAAECPDETRMKSWVYDIGDYSQFPSRGFPMACSRNFSRKEDPAFELVRLVGRIGVRMQNTSGYNVEIKSMILRHSVRKIAPFARDGFTASSASDVFGADSMNDRLSDADLQKFAEGQTVYMYCCENNQGPLLSGNSRPDMKSIYNIPEAKRNLVTHFEIAARLYSDAVRWENVYYRFCLGGDTVSDFSIKRNVEYSCCVNFRNQPYDTGWTVEPDNPQYKGSVGVTYRPAKYTPGWEVFTFPEASAANPVNLILSDAYGRPVMNLVVDGNRRNLPTFPSDVADSDYLLMGNKLFLRSLHNSDRKLLASQNGKKDVELSVPKKTRASLRMYAVSASRQIVPVQYALSGREYEFMLEPCDEDSGSRLSWHDFLYPSEIVDYYGESKISACWATSIDYDIGLYSKSTGRYVESLDPDDMVIAPEEEGQASITLTIPDGDYCLKHNVYSNNTGFSGSAYYDVDIFSSSSPVARTLSVLSLDNSGADLSNPARNGNASLSLSSCGVDVNSYGDCFVNCVPGIAYGTLGVSYASAVKSLNLRFDDYTNGNGRLDLLLWDYSKAPARYILPLKVYLDYTVVPNFGLLMNPGYYTESQSFSGASRIGSDTITGHCWGYQFIAARKDSRYGFDAYPQGGSSMMETLASLSNIQIRSEFANRLEHTSSVRLSWYNGGNFLYNDSYQVQDPSADNGGTILFCDPSILRNKEWTFKKTGGVWKNQTSADLLGRYAGDLLSDMASMLVPVLYRNGVKAREFRRQELPDGYMVNYKLDISTCIEQLTGDWNN